ncbi:hypothetical protein Q1695_000701 [Nippostrongylus brasiliensis]|nr:hypothetical protein Q1695_000701 [Nippostrongylus brasiliensis]
MNIRKLNILAVNVLCNRSSLESVYSICCELRQRRIGLHLSVLQNYPDPKAYESPFLDLKPPTSLFYVLTMFEASFVEDVVMFRSLLMSGAFKVLRECKFVECDALTSEVLQYLSEKTHIHRCRKLSGTSCSKKPGERDRLQVLRWSSPLSSHSETLQLRPNLRFSMSTLQLQLIELVRGARRVSADSALKEATLFEPFSLSFLETIVNNVQPGFSRAIFPLLVT